jgi:pimeloyl-ACP methyl ester carboxylesterase
VNPKPFTIDLDEDVLTDLRTRIRNTRWPDSSPASSWVQGTDLDYLKQIVAYWADEFDWRAQERRLNEFNHYHAEIDRTLIHFVHEPAASGQGIPLILIHGWPSTFIELLPLVTYLTNPRQHGLSGPGFDVVIPSLPGYGFSERPATTAVNYRYVAALWHKLMQGLGYRRYAAHGTDFGAGITTFMALDDPHFMIGIHLSNLEISPYIDVDRHPLSKAEEEYLQQSDRFWETEGGYKAIQSTKPQTLAYSLNDSPVGLAAWIIDKWRSWSDCHGDIETRFSRDFLLTNLTIYWVTKTISTSIRDYYDNRWSPARIGRDDFVGAPTAVALFANQFVDDGIPPREWAERLYNIQRWMPMNSGGHFAAVEEPELLARDISGFFTSLTR